MTRLRCLVVLDVAPLEDGRSGWSPRYAGLLKALEPVADVTLRYLDRPTPGTAPASNAFLDRPGLEVIPVPPSALTLGGPRGRFSRLLHLVSPGRPLACKTHAPPSAARTATRGEWDVAIVCLPWLAHLVALIEARAIYAFVEERWESVLFRTTATLPATLQRAFVSTELRRFESLYRSVDRQGARLVAIAPEEVAAFDRTIGAGRTICVPHGLDLDRWAAPTPAERDIDVLTYGLVSVSTNEDTLRSTIDAWDHAGREWTVLCQRSVPSWIGGRRHVKTVLDVEDVRPYLRRAKVCFVPSRISTGVRTTILEAWAMGCAVVTTTGGERGLPSGARDALRVGATPAECARLIQELLEDDDARTKVATVGQTAVAREADLTTLMKTFVDCLVAS